MSFPWHDPPWCEVGDLLEAAAGPSDRILAPDPFWWRFPSLWRYVPGNLDDHETYDWVVVHKGELPAIPKAFLEHVIATTTPVFANEVFVVFAGATDLRPIDPGSPHFLAFVAASAQLPPEPLVEHPVVSDRVLEASPTLRQFQAMSPAEARAAQDEFFAAGGYRYPTGRDRMYYAEIRQHRERGLRPGTRVLDLCSGAFPAAPLPPGVSFVRADFSAVGVGLAVVNDAGVEGVTHVVCDASAAAVAGGSFDTVMIMDSIEHVLDPELVIREAARALRIGGELVLTYANRNSLNQLLTRALGYPTFLTNHQHVNEFTFEEMAAMLDDAGLTIEETSGVELRPYWGVPGLDDIVRETLDEDEQLVEALRVLGRRAGIEYAYVGVVTARKRA